MKESKPSIDSLLAENTRLKSALEKSVAGIIVIDLSANITFVNNTWASMHGYKPDELLKKSMRMFFREKDYNAFLAILAKVKKVGSSSQELIQVKKDKSILPIWARVLLTKDEKEVPTGFVISALNLIKQKRHESELVKKTKELERFNRLFINRELKMVDLKKQVKKLEAKIMKTKK